MSRLTRRLGAALVIAAIGGAVVAAEAEHNLAETLIRLAITAGCALGVVLWLRPDAESDMICKAEVRGYLEGMSHRADVIPLNDRRIYEVGQRDSSPGPRGVPEQG